MFNIATELASSLVEKGVEIAEDAVKIGTSVVTLGQYGELSRSNLTRLVSNGISLASIADESGIAVEVLQDILHNR